jgi:hypothetical protein
MTGSRPQLYNGIILIATFGLCRLVWGTYQSINIYTDIWKALQTIDASSISESKQEMAKEIYQDASLPVLLAGTYLVSNTLLIVLNFYWFMKMIQAITKRFDKPSAKKQ